MGVGVSFPGRWRRRRGYRVVVSAMYLEPGTDNYKDVCDWLHAKGYQVSHDGAGSVTVEAPSGTVTARPGEWVVRAIGDRVFVCSPGAFAAEYEVAS